MKQTRELILRYVAINKRVRPDDLARHLKVSRVAMHRQLKRLVDERVLEKVGQAPRVFYLLADRGSENDQIVGRIRPVLLKHRVTRAELFGSRAQGEAEPESDVDILVALPKKASLLDLGKLYQDLKQAVGGNVDVVEYEAVHPYIRRNVFSKTIRVI